MLEVAVDSPVGSPHPVRAHDHEPVAQRPIGDCILRNHSAWFVVIAVEQTLRGCSGDDHLKAESATLSLAHSFRGLWALRG